MIDKERLWERLMALGEVGRSESGGVSRLSFTKEERAAKDLVASFMEEAGLEVCEDAVGNLIGRKEPRDCEAADAPTILLGSHVDSVHDGGRFDGALGVIAGIEVLQSLAEQGVEYCHPIEVVAFTDEEGARFGFGMVGSRALAGTLSTEDLHREDGAGVSIAEAMRDYGLDPDRIGEAARPRGSVQAYIELHIEQGRILESEGLPAGVVTGIAGPLWLGCALEGEAGHAGATPMGLRRDALAAAAETMSILEEEARATSTTVGTVGQLELSSGGINVIPGRVSFPIDLRDIDVNTRDMVEERVLQGAEKICRRRGVELAVETLQRVAPVPCSELVVEAAKAACGQVGLEPRALPSGAGHDAMQLAGLCPVGMVFVRSEGGASHNPIEWSSKEDCADGASILYYTVLNLASED